MLIHSIIIIIFVKNIFMETKLDDFLKLLYSKGIFVGINMWELASHMLEKNFPQLNITIEEYVIIRQILLQDNLIKEENDHVYITANGVLKILKGGYTQIILQQQKTISNQKLLNLANIFIIIAGIYYITEIIKTIVCIFK